jgi:hypothetical protein
MGAGGGRARRPGSANLAAACILAAWVLAGCGPGAGGGGGAIGESLPSGVIGLTAKNDTFSTTTLTAPANTPFRLRLDNADDGIQHGVAIMSGSTETWRGETFSGVGSRTYDVPALPAGTYRFVCPVHLGMTGTLTAGP